MVRPEQPSTQGRRRPTVARRGRTRQWYALNGPLLKAGVGRRSRDYFREMIAEYKQGKEFSINGFLRIRDDDVLFRQDRLGTGLKKVEEPAPQIAIVRLTVARDPLAKSDLRHPERDRRHQPAAKGLRQHSESCRGRETDERDNKPLATGPKHRPESCRKRIRVGSSGRRSAHRKALALTN